jgi:hypothetical protein
MDIFDVHRRDVYNFDQYMDLKKPGFGGNDSLIYDKDANGKKTSESNKLKDYRRVVKRDPLFKNPHYNSTYKAMSHDLVYKQEGEKPTTYPDPYLTGVATVEVGEWEDANESVLPSFNEFISESKDLEGSIKKSVNINDNVEKAIKEENDKLDKLQKDREKTISEGKCNSFKEFNSISENWYDMDYPETEEEIEIETIPDTEEGPENPPRRRNNPNPKNDMSLEGAVKDLMDYMGVSREEAEAILAIDVIGDLETAEPETEEEIETIPDTEEGPENPPRRRNNPNPKNKMDDLEEIIAKYGEGPDCYGEGPGCN